MVPLKVSQALQSILLISSWVTGSRGIVCLSINKGDYLAQAVELKIEAESELRA